VFTFHRPETFRESLRYDRSLRAGLQGLPALPVEDLPDCQINTITNLERSFKDNRPRAKLK
jgi:type I restriction enzyme R subunit